MSAIMVVLPEPVSPAKHSDIPPIKQVERKLYISTVHVPFLKKSSFVSFFAFTIRMEAATPASEPTISLLIAVTRMFFPINPVEIGRELSSSDLLLRSRRLTVSKACSGLRKESFSL